MATNKRHLVIIGGGFGGLRTFYNLSCNKSFDITVIDPREKHLMKPVMPEVAYEGKDIEEAQFELRPIIEKRGHTFINDAVEKIDPEANKIITKGGEEISYDYLQISSGAYKDFGAIKGLEEYGYSVCDDIHAPKLAEALKNFKGGKIAIGSAKSNWGKRVDAPDWWAPCEGPIGESMFMIDYYLKENGLRDKTEINVFTPGEIFFEDIGDDIRWAVGGLMGAKNLNLHLSKVTTEVTDKKVKFEDGTDLDSDLTIMIPVYRGPDFIKNSGLGDEAGMLPTDSQMRHLDYPNIFGAWDVNAITMPKLGHLAVMEADIVSAILKNEVGQNAKIPEYKPEILCIMNMGGLEAWVVLTDLKLGGKYDLVWHGMKKWIFKRMFDAYMIKTKWHVPPHFWINLFKKMVKMFGMGKK